MNTGVSLALHTQVPDNIKAAEKCYFHTHLHDSLKTKPQLRDSYNLKTEREKVTLQTKLYFMP